MRTIAIALCMVLGLAGERADADETAVTTGKPAGTCGWQKEEVPTVAVRAVLMTSDWSKPTRYQRAACAVVGKVARIVADNLDHVRRTGIGHPKWREVDPRAEVVNWQRSSCAEAGLRGPVSYVLAPEDSRCGAEDSAIRKMLCEVKQRMRQERQPPAAGLPPAASEETA